MKLNATIVLAAASLAFVVAACGGDSDSGATTTTAAPTTAAPTTAAPTTAAPTTAAPTTAAPTTAAPTTAAPTTAASTTSAAQSPPDMPSNHAGRTQCFVCHTTGAGGAPALPDEPDHSGFTDDISFCTTCHEAP